jgi:hypothetical protein
LARKARRFSREVVAGCTVAVPQCNIHPTILLSVPVLQGHVNREKKRKVGKKRDRRENSGRKRISVP